MSKFVVDSEGPFDSTRIQPAPWLDNISSLVVQDSVRYLHVNKKRFYWRVCFSLIAICTLIAITVGKYASTSELRNSYYITREPRYADKVNETEFALLTCTCPCNSQQIPWSNIARINSTVANLMGTDTGSYIEAQCNKLALIAASGNAAVFPDAFPTKDESLTAGNATSAQIANSSVLTASQQFCKISLSLFFQQVDRGTGKIAIGTQQPGQDTFTSSALRNDDQVKDAWTSYLTTKISGQKQIWLFSSYLRNQAPLAIAAYELDTDCRNGNANCTRSRIPTLDRLNTRNTNSSDQEAYLDTVLPLLAATDITLNNTAYVTGLQVLQAATSTSNSTTVLPYNQTLAGILRECMLRSVDLRWESYKDACSSSFCDVVKEKNPFYRATEFLSTLGGLWSTISAVVLIVWMACGMFKCMGSQSNAYESWH